MIYCEECSSYECGCQERKEIESLRQQIADTKAAVMHESDVAEAYKAEADRLEKQLAAALAAIKVKDAALDELADHAPWGGDTYSYQRWVSLTAETALAIQPDDSALKAWLGEPVAYDVTIMDGRKMLMRSFCDLVGSRVRTTLLTEMEDEMSTVKELRAWQSPACPIIKEAADLIEAQAAQIERLHHAKTRGESK